MKQIILSITTLAIALNLSAQKLSDLKPKGKKENAETSSTTTSSSVNIAPGASQSEMLEAFYNASNKFYYSMASAHLDNFSKPDALDKKLLFSELYKNESGKIIKFDTKIKNGQTFIARSKAYATYFQVNNESKTFYFLGDIAVFIERVQSEPSEPNNKQLNSQSGDVFLFSTNKDLIKNLKLADIQKLITDYLTAAQPKLTEARQKLKEERKANLGKSVASFECKNIKMNVIGSKICEYVGSHDSKKREVYVAINQDTIIYQIARSVNGQMEMLKRWAVPINIINASDKYFMTHFFMNDGEKIYKAMFPIISGHKYFYWQMLCDGNQYGKFEPETVSSTDMLEVTFDDEADCKEFFEEVKQIRARVETPDPNAASNKKDDKNASVRFALYNDSGADMEIWIGSSKSTIHKNETKSGISLKVGEKIYKGVPGSSQRGQVILTTSESLNSKTYYLGTGKIK